METSLSISSLNMYHQVRLLLLKSLSRAFGSDLLQKEVCVFLFKFLME